MYINFKEMKQVVVSNMIPIVFLNKNGRNLLDTQTVDHYNETDFKLFRYLDNKSYEIYNPHLTYPHNLRVIKDGSKSFLIIYTAENDNQLTSGQSVYLLKIKNREIDTVKTEWVRSKNGFHNTRVSYNNRQVWKAGDNNYQILKPIEILK